MHRPFTQLQKFFNKESQHVSRLHNAVGTGTITSHLLEEGLSVSLWDCTFNGHMDVHAFNSNTKNDSCTLLSFDTAEQIRFRKTMDEGKAVQWWDHLTLLPGYNFHMITEAGSKLRCISTSFSLLWLHRINKALRSEVPLWNSDLSIIPSIMNLVEKQQLEEVINSIRSSAGNLNIKSAVFNLLADYMTNRYAHSVLLEAQSS
jgi:hypothetical protein